MKQYVQSKAIEKRKNLLEERRKEVNAWVGSIVRKELAKQKKKYYYIITICIVVAFVLGVLTRYIILYRG